MPDAEQRRSEGSCRVKQRRHVRHRKPAVLEADPERRRALAALGGAITGLTGAGLPEIVTTQLVARCRMPPRVAGATSVFVLAIAAVAGAAVHALAATPVWYVVVWSIPGVIVGGTIGARVGKHVPSRLMERGLGVVFGIVGGILVTTFGV